MSPEAQSVALSAEEAWQLEGPFDSHYSLAIENRELALALSEAGLDIRLVSRDGPGPFEPNAEFLRAHPRLAEMYRRADPSRIPAVALRNTYPPLVDDLKGTIRGLACYAWEESEFPYEYVESINRNLQFVTVISEFVAKILCDNGVSVPIFVVGCGIDQMTRENVDHSQGSFELADVQAGTCFLHVSSCLPRKGVDVLLRAWREAFNKSDDVALIIKATPNQHHQIDQEVATLIAAHPDMAPIKAINAPWPDAQMRALYDRADVVVAASRGEGFCLPLAEALALGKPVIATAYGGQTDFCTPENSWLCDFDFAYSASHVSSPGSVWAEPKTAALVDCLRQAESASPQERLRRGEAGRRKILSRCTWKNVGENLVQAVDQIRTADRIDAAAADAGQRIAWVSPWNTADAVADYSHGLSQRFPGRLLVLANHAINLIRRDEDYVVRCWTLRSEQAAEDICSAIAASDPETVVIQYSPELLSIDGLLTLLRKLLAQQRRRLFVTLHATGAVMEASEAVRSELVGLLRELPRLCVHAVHDLNRLKELGVVNNVTLFPFGVPASPRVENQTDQASQLPSERASDTRRSSPLIATFGSPSTDKGHCQFIEAFSLLRQRVANARLLLLACSLNADVNDIEKIESELARFHLRSHVTLRTEYLVAADVVDQLSRADLIVFPYQRERRSVSSAVHYALAAQRPVATTPLTMFRDLRSMVEFLPGTSPGAMAVGMERILAAGPWAELAQARRAFIGKRAWPRISERFRVLVDAGVAAKTHSSTSGKKIGQPC